MSYCRPFRTNYTTFYSQNQIKHLQHFYSILIDVRVLIERLDCGTCVGDGVDNMLRSRSMLHSSRHSRHVPALEFACPPLLQTFVTRSTLRFDAVFLRQRYPRYQSLTLMLPEAPRGYSSGHPMPGILLSQVVFSLDLVNLVCNNDRN